MIARLRRLNRLVTALAAVTILLRAIIPLGYMPGNALAGEFMVLCPAGVPAAVMEVLHPDHGHHGGHAASVINADRDCPIGSALQPAWLPADFAVTALELAPFAAPQFYFSESFSGLVPRRYESRAPPA